MKFEFKNDMPIYTQLTSYIKLYIVSGKLKPNEKLPSVRDLAFNAKVNPNTVQKALEKLENEGLIYTERTNRKYVTNNLELIEKIKFDLAKEKTKHYIEDMKNLGFSQKDTTLYLQKNNKRE